MERTRIGIIGLGIMGSLYAKIYSAHPLAEVVAVSAPRQDQIDKVRSLYGLATDIRTTGRCWSGKIWTPWWWRRPTSITLSLHAQSWNRASTRWWKSPSPPARRRPMN